MMEITQIIGFVAGFGTTFAAMPDLIAMLKRRSRVGMNPRIGRDLGHFPDSLGNLQPFSRLEEHRHVECDCDSDQLSYRWGIFLLSSPRRAT